MADQPGAAALSECGGQACQGQDDPRSGGGADSGRGSRRVRRPTGVLGMGSSALLEMSVSMVMSVMGTTAELGRDELRSGAHMQGWSGEVPKMPSPSRARKTLNRIEGSSRTPNVAGRNTSGTMSGPAFL